MSWPDVGGRKIKNTHHSWGWRGPNTYVHVNSRAACWRCGFRALSTTQQWLGSDNTDGVAAGLLRTYRYLGMKWRPGEFFFTHTPPQYSAKARKILTSGSSHCMGPSTCGLGFYNRVVVEKSTPVIICLQPRAAFVLFGVFVHSKQMLLLRRNVRNLLETKNKRESSDGGSPRRSKRRRPGGLRPDQVLGARAAARQYQNAEWMALPTPRPGARCLLFLFVFFFLSRARVCVCSYPQARPHHQNILFPCSLAAAVHLSKVSSVFTRAGKKKTKDQ